MGIPSYFGKMIRDNPDLIYNQERINENNIEFENIFIDFNGCIYGCLEELKREYTLIDLYKMNESIFEDLLIEKVIKHIKFVRDYTCPRRNFVIAIDGKPPYAKMIQQRSRRYMTMWVKNRLIEYLNSDELDEVINEINGRTGKDSRNFLGEYIKSEWNTNAISPGTKFMRNLECKVKEKLELLRESDNGVDYIMSGSDEDGEGEHKIFKMIIDNEEKYMGNTLIYGLDADLIMLSLLNSNNERNIYLMREPHHINKKLLNEELFLFIPIEEYKKYMNIYYNNYIPNNENMIRNYVFICFFLGNDFIPHIPFLEIKMGGLDILLRGYGEVIDKYGKERNIIEYDWENMEYKIDYEFMLRLLRRVSEISMDIGNVRENTERYRRRKMNRKNKIENINCLLSNIRGNISEDIIYKKILRYLNNKIDRYPVDNINIEENIVNYGVSGWEERYKKNILLIGRDKRRMHEINKNYLESIKFTMEYYYNLSENNENKYGNKKWYHPTFYYRYEHGPLISDICSEIETELITNKDEIIRLEYNDYYPKIEITKRIQHLIIFPFISKNLIENMDDRRLLSGLNENNRKDGWLSYIYPRDFMVDSYGCEYGWQCKVRIPYINIKKLEMRMK
jgi:5'-3' exonuclease